MDLPETLAATLVLVRHGESVWVAEGRFQGRANPRLSELGERQARLVAQRLAERGGGVPLPVPPGPPIGIWYSPLARAADTARLIAELQPPSALHETSALTEIAQGKWEGLTRAQVAARWAAELAAWQRAPADNHAPGGEALPAAAKRVASATAEVVAALAAAQQPASAEPWALLVAHDGIFRLALLALLGLPLDRFWSFPFNLGAISVLGIRDGAVALRAHNLSEHLASLADQARASAEASGDRAGAL